MADPQVAPNGIVLYWYKASPYGRRVAWYLALRNIAHAQCFQPAYLPRPDLDSLSISYRRSPVMAINRSIYLDTRLMLSTLDTLFPNSPEHPALTSPSHTGLSSLLQKLSTESVFGLAVRLLPPQSPMLKDEKFLADRKQFSGGKSMVASKESRAEAEVHMFQIFQILEDLLSDGRKWIAGTEEVSSADLEAVWPVDWVVNDMRPGGRLCRERFPRVFEWQGRFRALVKERIAQNKGTVVTVEGERATRWVLGAGLTEGGLGVDGEDPTGLREGEVVEVFPTDGGGFFHQDRGRLVGLSAGEVVIEKEVQGTGKKIRVHAPRWQFRVRRVKGGKEKL